MTLIFETRIETDFFNRQTPAPVAAGVCLPKNPLPSAPSASQHIKSVAIISQLSPDFSPFIGYDSQPFVPSAYIYGTKNMSNRIPTRQKWLLAIALMTLFYPIMLYVNMHDRTWEALRKFLIWVAIPEYVFGILVTFLFIFWAERVQAFFDRRFEAGIGNKKQFFFNALALFIFLGSGLLVLLASIWGIQLFLQHVTGVIDNAIQSENDYMRRSMRFSYGQFSIMILFMYFVLLNRRMLLRTQQIRLKTEYLQKEKALSQFTTLKNQVNPHFLFNSLSILSSLVRVDPDLSEIFIDRLSKAYRYILEQRDQESVPLKTELEFLNAFAFLLQARFENKFKLEIDIPEAVAETCHIAPMTLQLLVENAVKYNRMSVKEPLTMHIFADKDDIVIENPLRLRPQTDNVPDWNELDSIRNQYVLLTERAVRVIEADGMFTVRLPMLPPLK